MPNKKFKIVTGNRDFHKERVDLIKEGLKEFKIGQRGHKFFWNLLEKCEKNYTVNGRSPRVLVSLLFQAYFLENRKFHNEKAIAEVFNVNPVTVKNSYKNLKYLGKLG